MLEKLVIGLLADGHILLEGVPGLAKTLMVLCGLLVYGVVRRTLAEIDPLIAVEPSAGMGCM